MSRLEWIDYKGKKILYSDCSNLKTEEANRKQLEIQMDTIAKSKEPVLLLVNVEGSVMTPANTEYTKKRLQELGKKVKKSALVGVTGFKPVIVEGIGRAAGDLNQAMFATLDEAKDWLIS